ncbi:DNA repair protein RadC [Brevibacillus halotolerans]|uniref:JAB domain-containing protein n=1 Tax=Brevibacillus TaxID=55080 RepID=UPI00215D0658|nr:MULTISPECIES: DNA repair protein RadC [Brevibacillus]MCR8964057.1 DNA repair protein RadC [Brevibacillus laterosporus]MCZ0836212.1 DNA repair protein RadC [Brevibacillus halotolerans]
MGAFQKSTTDLSTEVNSSIKQIYKRIEKGETDTITLLMGLLGKSMKEKTIAKLHYLGLNKLSQMTLIELKQIEGIGEIGAMKLYTCFQLNESINSKRIVGEVIDDPKKVADYMMNYLINLQQEQMVVLCLNTKLQVISQHVVGIGTMFSICLQNKDIFKHAISNNAARVILVHNHVSGNSKPSDEDFRFTESIIKIGNFIGIPVEDHVIIGNQEYYSFRKYVPSIFNENAGSISF